MVQSLVAADCRCDGGVMRHGINGWVLSNETELAVVLALAGAFCAILDTLELEMLAEAAEVRSGRAVKAR